MKNIVGDGLSERFEEKKMVGLELKVKAVFSRQKRLTVTVFLTP